MTINTDILKNTAGLVMWLDGEINSRAGVRDTSINGMQNLVYTPFAGKSTTTGFLEKLNGTATFKDKGVQLGGTCFYPSYAVDDLTFEICINLQPTTSPVGLHMLFANMAAPGFQFHYTEPSLRFQAMDNVDVTKQVDANIGTGLIHFACTSKLSQADSTKMYLNGSLIDTTGFDGVASPASMTNWCAGVGGFGNTSPTSIKPSASNPYVGGSFHCTNDIFHSVRLWSRQLSEKEVLDNYKRDFERFGE